MITAPPVRNDSAPPVVRFNDYAGMVDAFRAMKAWLQMSNQESDRLCGMIEGHTDKLLGPTCARVFSPLTFNKIAWVNCVEIEMRIDINKVRELEQHYEKRCAANTRDKPNRISKKIIQTATPQVMRRMGEIGGKVTFAKMTDAERSAHQRKAACSRWRKWRRSRKQRALDKLPNTVRCSRARLRQS